MPYVPHDAFQPPASPEQVLWRYMTLPKLVSLLHTSKLWFSRADLLGDRHEGAYGEANVRARPAMYADVFAELEKNKAPEDPFAVIEAYRRVAPGWTFVNCWNQANIESVAMWRTYALTGQAVAVRSTYKRFIEALRGPEEVQVGIVDYVDYDTTLISERNLMSPFLVKRLSFEYERELRGVIMQPVPGGIIPNTPSPQSGIAVDVDLDRLVDCIYVGPDEPEWFRAAVDAVVQQFLPGKAVEQSDLSRDPLY